MTEFSLPPLVVGWDNRWVQVPLSGNLDDWARKAAEKYVASHGGSKRQVGGCWRARVKSPAARETRP